MSKRIFLFQSTRHVITAERHALRQGFAVQVVPVPREVSSECGLALEMNDTDVRAVGQLLGELQIPFRLHPPGEDGRQ